MAEHWELEYERWNSVSPPSSDDPLHEMSDFYGQTPPRTRQSRRQRERKQRISWGETKSSPVSRDIRTKPSICRRDTLDTIIFNKMCEDADEARDKEEAAKEGSRKSKRSLKLARGNERDLKLDVEAAAHYAERSERRSAPVPCNMKIETRNRFRCLRSKPVDVDHKRREHVPLATPVPVTPVDNVEETKPKNLKEREVFHDTFAFLIRLGSTDREKNCRRQMSSEESRWQNELKDLIWLELQAYHADRSLVGQDEYLCKQREAIGPLLTEIMEYRYSPAPYSNPSSAASSSNDSGFEGSTPMIVEPTCMGCLCMRCRPCSRAQLTALKQVESLLCRLEAAEALYPSCQAFATNYPMYKSPEFTGRVKAMCLWYNMTRHHRLKLQILGKLLMLLDSPKNLNYEVDSGNSSRSSETTDFLDPKPTVVRFELSSAEDSANSTPSDSTNSNSSTGGISLLQSWPSTPESATLCGLDDHRLDCLDHYLMEFDRQAYRKYIEEVLKTRGLSKSLNFLERLHTSVLRKASLAMKKWTTEEELSTSEEYEGDIELKRYGVWSPEAKALNLPSYRSAFIFLSRVPLDIVHEFLRMRLEQKPEQPGPLSVRQLMREMREGLKIACIHRDRFVEHSKTVHAFDDCIPGKPVDSPPQSPLVEFDDVKDFDDSLQSVFEVYLDYLRQWVEMVQYNSFHKSLIDDEWSFVKSIAGGIQHGYKIGGIKFCGITCTMIEQIQEFLVTRPQEIKECTDALEGDESIIKLQLMSAGREWQGMFVEAREKITKCLTFAKFLKKDISQWPDVSGGLSIAVCQMKSVILSLRDRLIILIENFQAKIDEAEEPKSENDQLAMKTRVREILHQAYRMGFDYHKEVCKLFPTEERGHLVHGLVDFAMLWMDFVKNRCERGRGLRPRWANHGFEYLMTVCEPSNTKYLSDREFEALKEAMDRCISHVVGAAAGPGSHTEQDGVKRLPRSRASSPGSSGSRTSFCVSKTKDSLKSPEGIQRKYSSPHSSDGSLAVSLTVPEMTQVKKERILSALKKLESEIDERRRGSELIGRVTDRKSVDKIKVRIKRVTFTWQRGIKIGQGRFGKVYTVVNNQTGELLAMKEVALQPGDHRAVRRLVEELQIFEGIQHRHLVRYYGIEIQREEMLLFMEFCAEGTLESLVAGSGNGLPEIFVRKYTHQLLLAVSVLHNHGIVHRDIKTANIFLTDQGNCLKLGDFGCAVQIKAHTTMPGELQGFVGTQAYMAPEVFMKTESGGHGRAADVWSVGCCVVEMASGKRPWAEFDSNYQIMFKVGMGESPTPPKHLCVEGVDLATRCLTHDPKKRPTANSLLSHPFARNYDDVNVDLLTRVPS
ncbi:mitogen-activated protein kinase kinase kinase 4 isoform X2 [Fopius arisanus]|uniref:Mitogen-activated protein kinase kinase kinase 4 isoform X2 n=1 Tax=Fopius arisanus TaxID=64838 RepID=A0A9R1T4X7_9HYME|nr:PREDICTED: mitogen-activated protein kinase kinase kinase 4 isoform X2 [Fopius arisanus]